MVVPNVGDMVNLDDLREIPQYHFLVEDVSYDEVPTGRGKLVFKCTVPDAKYNAILFGEGRRITQVYMVRGRQ